MKHRLTVQLLRTTRWIPSTLFLAFIVQCGLLQGSENVSAISTTRNPTGSAQDRARADDRLSPAAFADPPVQARPGGFWAWLNGSITEEQITRDLEAMKKGGMRGGEIWDVAAMADPDRRVPAGPAFLGPESTRLIVHAIREADRLGLEIGLVASSGWNAGGSWITPEHAGKGLYQSVTTVTGPTNFHAALPLPELPKLCPRDEQGRPIYLREVAVLAVPDDKSNTIADANQVVDLTEEVGADGKLRWDAPAGDWTILRFVCTNHGQRLIVPSPNSGGPMIDFFDPARHRISSPPHCHHDSEGTGAKVVCGNQLQDDGVRQHGTRRLHALERHDGR